MERFTYKDASGNWVIACNRFWNYLKLKFPAHVKGEAVDRLAAYEDTGLEPQDIEKIRKDVEAGFLKQTARRYGVKVDRIRELMEADREGRCTIISTPERLMVYENLECDVKPERLLELAKADWDGRCVIVTRCSECKNHVEFEGKHYCKFWRMYCPNDSEFYCKAALKGEHDGKDHH